MRSHRAVLAAVVAAGCASPPRTVPAPSAAPPPTVAITTPAVSTTNDLTIVAQQVPEGLRVTYELSRPAHEFHFAEQAGPARTQSWKLVTPDLVLDGETITSSAPGA